MLSRLIRNVTAVRPTFRCCSTQQKQSAYQTALKNYPLLTQAVQTSVLMGCGDLVAQLFVENTKLEDVNLRRTANFLGIGFFIAGPGLRYWYGFLERSIKGKTVAVRVVKKVAVDQLVFAPTFLAGLLGMLAVLQGDSLEGAKKKIQNDYKDVLMTNYTIWPAFQLANFALTPLNYQVLTVQFVAIFWNTYLSWKTNSNTTTTKPTTSC